MAGNRLSWGGQRRQAAKCSILKVIYLPTPSLF